MQVKLIMPSGSSSIITLDKSIRVGQYFTLSELANNNCQESIKYIISPKQMKFIEALDKHRAWYKKPMRLSCSYRSPSWNKQVGGKPNSLHLKAQAADVQIGRCTDLQAEHHAARWQAICELMGEVGEIGFYDWGIHLGLGIEYSAHFYRFDNRTRKG